MKEIRVKDKLLAVVHKKKDWKEGLNFITNNDAFIQVGTWWYNLRKELKPHFHIYNPRNVEYTQEVIIIMSGSLLVDFYDYENLLVYSDTFSEGDIVVILGGGHGYKILEDNTKVVEIKNGPFFSVEKDKKLI